MYKNSAMIKSRPWIACRLNPVEEIMPRILQNQRLTYELMAELFGEEPIELPTGDEDN